MTHTVKSGETLSMVARAHRITLAQLLEANPRFAPHPDRIRVGDILNIPDGGTSPVQPPPPVQPRPQPQPAANRVLGKLSEQFETGGRGPGTVSTGAGDAGGVSYGSYQMTSKPGGGTVKRFVAAADFPFRDKFANLDPGSSQFTAAWKELATQRRDEFQRSQHDFIKKTHFDPLVRKILQENGLNVLTRSHALQDVIWSTAVQHGPNSGIPGRVLQALGVQSDDPRFDESFIIAIYAERGRKNATGGLVHFSRNSPAVQNGVARRFRDEQAKALEMLARERTG